MTAARFPRSAHLRKPADFAGLRREAKRIGTTHFQSQFRPTECGEPRLGMAVSRRVSKNAVARNRIRRLVRESFRHRRAQLPACDILLIARVGAAEQSAEALRADLDLIWNRLTALKPHERVSTRAPPS